MSQLINLIPASGPGSGTVTSITFNGGLTSSPDPITAAGTATIDQTNLTIQDGTVYWDTGTQLLNTTATGTAGQVLTSQGAGLPPIYAAAASGGITTLTADAGVPTTASSIEITTGYAGNCGSTVLFTSSASAVGLTIADANNNHIMGLFAGNTSVSGADNVSFGGDTLTSLTSGSFNTAMGEQALSALTTGSYNVAIGGSAASVFNTGSFNVAIGGGAGSAWSSSESNNVAILDLGVAGDSGVTRINTLATGSDGGASACYIGGIYGVTTANPVPVTIDSITGQLGSGSGGGGGITTINVDNSGSVTGSTIDLFANSGSANAGSSVKFIAVSGTEIDLQVTDANYNTIIGNSSGNGTLSASDTVALGFGALAKLTSGNNNVAIGAASCENLTTSPTNVGVGFQALDSLTTGSGINVGIGYGAGFQLKTGAYNTLIGYIAGYNYAGAESSNIVIGYNGVSGGEVLGESNVLRLGPAGTGTGSGQINSAYISGIFGKSPAAPQMVTINSSNQLGSQAIPTSSISITGDSGGELTGSAFTFTGGTTGLTFAGAGSTETLGGTLAIANGGTNTTSFTQSNGIVIYNGTRLVNYAGPQISSAGIQTNTTQPAFWVYQNTSPTGLSGIYTLAFNTAVLNQGSYFNTSTYTFTAPVTGFYQFNVTALLTSVTGTGTTYQLIINKNSGTDSSGSYTGTANLASGGYYGSNFSTALPLNATDTIKFQVNVSGSGVSYGVDGAIGYTFASGYLIC